MHSNWTVFRSLCRIIGGQDDSALRQAIEDGVLSQIVAMARSKDLLPALAMRVDEQPAFKQAIAETDRQLLHLVLRENTRKNMQTVMQALKLTRALNDAGITPTFLKGTAQLLTVNQARLGFRTQIDIDLVVAPKDLRDACQALLEAGYGFYRDVIGSSNQPVVLHDIDNAMRTSAAHHHLPPMVSEAYANSVELHRHFLPSRFQRKNPLQSLLDTTHQHEQHGATFRVPSAEYQVIHMVLGKLVNDGYQTRRDFPIREGCDYIELLDSLEVGIDRGLVQTHCGENYGVFTQLVTQLMAYKGGEPVGSARALKQHLLWIEKRYNSAGIARLLDARARAKHLGYELLYSPAKLPAYLRRLGGD